MNGTLGAHVAHNSCPLNKIRRAARAAVIAAQLFLLLVTGCTTRTLPQGWEVRWLAGIPCQPPCWEGVTPGETTGTQAVAILQKSPMISRVSFDAYSAHRVSWQWITGQDGGSALLAGTAASSRVEGIAPVYVQPFSLRAVLAAFGEPSHIIAGSSCGVDAGSGVFYHLFLIYWERGLLLKAQPPAEIHARPILSPDMLLDEVVFFAPDEAGLRSVISLSIAELSSRKWRGFESFDAYLDKDLAGACP
jgi:hypothetical protein